MKLPFFKSKQSDYPGGPMNLTAYKAVLGNGFREAGDSYGYSVGYGSSLNRECVDVLVDFLDDRGGRAKVGLA